MSKTLDKAMASIVADIAASIEHDQVTGKWTAPWHTSPAMFDQVNATTEGRYTGSNVVSLAFRSHVAGYKHGVWATYKQWTAAECAVTKGEKGTQLVRWVRANKKDAEGEPIVDDDGEKRTIMVPVIFHVFNVDQVTGPKADEIRSTEPTEPTEFAGDDLADAWIDAIGADIRYGGTSAYYSPATDSITLPDRADFTSGHGFYSTALHELTHWTSHKDRCDRQLGKRFGDKAYAVEELIAELGAAMSCSRIGLLAESRDDHARYLKSWLGVLKEKPAHLYHVAGQAQKASDFLAASLPES